MLMERIFMAKKFITSSCLLMTALIHNCGAMQRLGGSAMPNRDEHGYTSDPTAPRCGHNSVDDVGFPPEEEEEEGPAMSDVSADEEQHSQERIQLLYNQVEELDNDNQQLRAQIADIRAENHALHQSLAEHLNLEPEIQRLTDANQTLTDQNRHLQETIITLRREILGLRQELITTRHKQAESAQIEEQNRTLRARIANLRLEQQRLLTLLQQQTAQNTQLATQLTNLRIVLVRQATLFPELGPNAGEPIELPQEKCCSCCGRGCCSVQ
jgi:hypothetical protein